MKNYYVYVYIDPRNLEGFYYGKGKGSRKNAHLREDSDTEKSKRIKAIKKEGLNPIIRVIARNLSEHDAFLVEKTLIWKLGRQLTNISPGHYGDNFRPHDNLHKELSGFDFQNGLYYYNVGEGEDLYRCWEEYMEYSFIAAGGGTRYRDAMLGFEVGDVFAAYIPGPTGYVGIGRITHKATPIRDVQIDGTPLLSLPLKSTGLKKNVNDDDNCEYIALVEWITVVDRCEAKWKSNSGIFASQLVRASLDAQPETIKYLEQEFSVNLRKLIE
jgi:hypothetical protein